MENTITLTLTFSLFFVNHPLCPFVVVEICFYTYRHILVTNQLNCCRFNLYRHHLILGM